LFATNCRFMDAMLFVYGEKEEARTTTDFDWEQAQRRELGGRAYSSSSVGTGSFQLLQHSIQAQTVAHSPNPLCQSLFPRHRLTVKTRVCAPAPRPPTWIHHHPNPPSCTSSGNGATRTTCANVQSRCAFRRQEGRTRAHHTAARVHPSAC
jgi:hypothetical protein